MPRTSHWIVRRLSHLDGVLLLLVLAVLGISLAVVASASGQSPARITGHLINIGLALSVMIVMANVPPHILSRVGPPLYVAGVVLLIGVALFGEIRNGSRRWLNLGFMAFQPSELLKLALPLMLAWYFQRNEAILRAKHYSIGGVLLLVPFLLTLRQPDLGTALMLGASGFYLLFFAGLPWKAIFGGATLGAASLPVVWGMMHDYQHRRVLTLLDPTADPLGDGYHIIQSTIAIGSGGLFGKGWMQGTQNQLDFIPERTTDFIYAVFGEEFGYARRDYSGRPVPGHGGARAHHRSTCPDPVWAADGGHAEPEPVYLCVRQHGDGVGHFAGGGCAPAADELWRNCTHHPVAGRGYPDERGIASSAQ